MVCALTPSYLSIGQINQAIWVCFKHLSHTVITNLIKKSLPLQIYKVTFQATASTLGHLPLQLTVDFLFHLKQAMACSSSNAYHLYITTLSKFVAALSQKLPSSL